MALGLALVGCEGGKPSPEWQEKFRRFAPAENYYIVLHAGDADARRRAVVRIAQSRYLTADEAFSVLDTAARTDANAQVRCAALLALRRYWDGRPAATALAILNPKAHPNEALPATRPVRWDATLLLVHLSDHGLIPDDRREEALDVLVSLLLHDEDRDVQMAAARGLGGIPDVRSLRALIASLRQKDFGIAYEAERSLMKLTGRGFRFDADAWQEWLDATPDPFDRANRTTSAPAP